MQQQFSTSESQKVECASRSRLRPVVSLLGAPLGAQSFGHIGRHQVPSRPSWSQQPITARLRRTTWFQVSGPSGMACYSASACSEITVSTVAYRQEKQLFIWRPSANSSVAQSRVRRSALVATIARARPNPILFA